MQPELLVIICYTTIINSNVRQQTLLRLYRSLIKIRSKLDYGCVVYGSARPSYFKLLDPIQNHVLRLCLGAFRTSPTTSLYLEANEPPQRKKLSLQFCLKLSANSNNPAYNAVFNSEFKTQFDNKPIQTWPMGLRVSDDLQSVGFKKRNVFPTAVSTIAPWLLKCPAINLSLCSYDKTTTSPELFKHKFFELWSELSNHLEIYTDVSKDGLRTAAAVAAPSTVKKVCLPNNTSIFTAEIRALNMALGII